VSRTAHLAYAVGTGTSVCGRQSDCEFNVTLHIIWAKNTWNVCSSCSQASPCAKIFKRMGDAMRTDTIYFRQKERERELVQRTFLRIRNTTVKLRERILGWARLVKPYTSTVTHTHSQGFVLNQAAVFAVRRKVVNGQLNCKSFSVSSFGEYCVR